MEQDSDRGEMTRVLMEFAVSVGRFTLLLYPVYACGALGLSVSWVVLTLLLWEMWEKNRRRKNQRVEAAIDFVDNECHVIKSEMMTALNSPAWIHFDEVEKAAWINKILQQAWPFFAVYMDKLMKESIQTTVRHSSPHLKTFKFTKVHFGQKAPTVTGIRAYTHEVDRREVILDFNIVYDGDIDIDVDVKPGIAAGVKEIELQGMLRVILNPLIGQSPLVGGVTMFFIRRPTMQFNWTGMTNLLDSPALRAFSETAILDIIASLMVLPNRMCFPLIDQVKMEQMRFPLPRGVVRVHILAAKNLKAMDTVMMGIVQGRSDPYAVLTVGNQRNQTKTIKRTLYPTWNEAYEFVIHEAPGQELELEIYDEDTDKDDFIGRLNLDFGEVKNEGVIDKWFPLEDIECGEVHMKLQWLSLQTDPELMKKAEVGCAGAMLAVYLENASNLSIVSDQPEKHGRHSKATKVTKKRHKPDSYINLTVDQQTKKSKIVFDSSDPVFEEYFTFFVHSVENQVLNIQVMLAEKKTSLGMLNLPLLRLLHASDLTLDQHFKLERSGANSRLKMKAILRFLKPEPKVINPPVINMNDTGNQVKHPHLQQPQQFQSDPKTTTENQASTSQIQVPVDSSTGYQPDYMPRRGSLMVPGSGSGSNPMRRYDSHSLLSENSIASSRLDLADSSPYPEAIMNHQGSFGQIQLVIRYVTLRNKLTVTVICCKNLFACNINGSDTYVRIYLLPDQTWKHRMRTKVKKKTVNPVFEEKVEFSVPLEEAKVRRLDVSVKNNRMFHTRERKEIGMVLIDLAQLDIIKGSTEWYELSIPALKKAV